MKTNKLKNPPMFSGTIKEAIQHLDAALDLLTDVAEAGRISSEYGLSGSAREYCDRIAELISSDHGESGLSALIKALRNRGL